MWRDIRNILQTALIPKQISNIAFISKVNEMLGRAVHTTSLTIKTAGSCDCQLPFTYLLTEDSEGVASMEQCRQGLWNPPDWPPKWELPGTQWTQLSVTVLSCSSVCLFPSLLPAVPLFIAQIKDSSRSHWKLAQLTSLWNWLTYFLKMQSCEWNQGLCVGTYPLG